MGNNINTHDIYMEIAQIMHNRLKLCIVQDAVEETTLLEIYKQSNLKTIEHYLLEEKEEESSDFEPLKHIIKIGNLNEFERFILYLMLSAEISEDFQFDCAKFHGDSRSLYVTPYLAKYTYGKPINGEDIYQMLSAEGIIGKLLFSEYNNAQNIFLYPLILNDRMRFFFFYSRQMYPPYQHFMSVWFPSDEKLIPYHKKLIEQIYKIITKYQNSKPLILCMQGDSGSGRKQNLKFAAQKLNRPLIFFDINYLESVPEKKEALLTCFIQECLLWNAIPVLCNIEQNSGISFCKRLGFHFKLILCTCNNTTWVNKSDFQDFLFFTIKINDFTLKNMSNIWKQIAKQYPLDTSIEIEQMVEKFNFTIGKIKNVFEIAELSAIKCERNYIKQSDLDESCYMILEEMMNYSVKLVKTQYSFEQLVLPERQTKQLRSVCNHKKYQDLVYREWGFEQIQTYGRGLSMVFFGAPGTGKTMAAQVIAIELGLKLYRVELNTVYSKFIGETEKNLDDIFEQAKRSQVILFFDEADILFSKRTEINNSNDKYSNMEAAYLLQKMEEYEGITILATNYIDNFDPAFKRRIKFMIQFPFPDESARKIIWEKMIPDKVPHEEIDYAFLSTFELSGSQIKNIVLNAAFQAASKNIGLSMKLLICSLKDEFEKNNLIIQIDSLREYM